MTKKEFPRAIDNLKKISIQKLDFLNEGKESTRSFGLGGSNVSFIGIANISHLQETCENIYSSNQEIRDTISFKSFEKEIINLIRKLKTQNRKCSQDDIDQLLLNLLEPESVESEVLYELYGCEMESETLQLGEFTIYNLTNSEEILIQKYPYLSNRDIFSEKRNSNYLLGIKVKVRENAKATELADEIVESFENAFNYMISDLKHQRQIGILNYRGWRRTSRLICNHASIGFNGTSEIKLPVNIEDGFFVDPSLGNDKVWNLLTKKGKSEIEKRLVQSIEWIGRGILDPDKSKALVQFVFAIEGMLQYDGKNLITPSIVSQLSDWLAFIIQDDPEERQKIAKYFKQTYRKRSAIVHGGNKSIDIDDLNIALQIAKHMTIAFLKDKPFSDFKTMDDLSGYINKLKFQ